MRGKVRGIQTALVVGGITPADAGKRQAPTGSAPPSWDHPRVCGEKAVAIILWYSWMGSPPRMRGKD